MNKMPTVEEAEKILVEIGCPGTVVRHSKTVRKLAVQIGKRLVEYGINVDLSLIGIGALLHDIGRVKTHSVLHGFYGGEIARSFNLPESLIHIIERHMGAGIPASEAAALGLPNRSFTPKTLEEKIVTYADKRVRNDKVITFEESLEEFRKNLGEGHPSIERLNSLHKEIISLLNSREKRLTSNSLGFI